MALTVTEDRIVAINTVIGCGMAVANDHPQDANLWIGSVLGALMELGVTAGELAKAVQEAPFIEKSMADRIMLAALEIEAEDEAKL